MNVVCQRFGKSMEIESVRVLIKFVMTYIQFDRIRSVWSNTPVSGWFFRFFFLSPPLNAIEMGKFDFNNFRSRHITLNSFSLCVCASIKMTRTIIAIDFFNVHRIKIKEMKMKIKNNEKNVKIVKNQRHHWQRQCQQHPTNHKLFLLLPVTVELILSFQLLLLLLVQFR